MEQRLFMRISDLEILVDLVAGSNVTEVTVESEGKKVTIRKALHPQSVATPAPAAAVSVEAAGKPVAVPAPPSTETGGAPEPDNRRVITASMVGVFHRLEDVAQPGSHVDKGQVIGAIESMKLMNDVRAEYSGVVVEVLVEDGMPVEYGQPILILEQ